jgi:hypothetical protein
MKILWQIRSESQPALIVGQHIRYRRQNENAGNEKPAPEKPERVTRPERTMPLRD